MGRSAESCKRTHVGMFSEKGQKWRKHSKYPVSWNSNTAAAWSSRHGSTVRISRYQGKALKNHGLCVAWRDRQAQARGVGGEAKVVGVAEVPL